MGEANMLLQSPSACVQEQKTKKNREGNGQATEDKKSK
jgi:hypothetical protein